MKTDTMTKAEQLTDLICTTNDGMKGYLRIEEAFGDNVTLQANGEDIEITNNAAPWEMPRAVSLKDYKIEGNQLHLVGKNESVLTFYIWWCRPFNLATQEIA